MAMRDNVFQGNKWRRRGLLGAGLTLGASLFAVPAFWFVWSRRQTLTVTEEASGVPVLRYIENKAAALADYFRQLGYTLGPIREERQTVPRIFVHSLPADLDQMPEVEERKRLFLKTLLPLVLQENERLRAERLHMFEVIGRLQQPATPEEWRERKWLARLQAAYQIGERSQHRLQRLQLRVDTVPVSLALAQAALESGWGTSRFVQEGNALFGLWTWSADHEGIVPLLRPENATYRVRAFHRLGAAVRVYMRTLNTHRAYARFRIARARFRSSGSQPRGEVLARELSNFSELRQDYVARVRAVMDANELAKLESSRLQSLPGGIT